MDVLYVHRKFFPETLYQKQPTSVSITWKDGVASLVYVDGFVADLDKLREEMHE